MYNSTLDKKSDQICQASFGARIIDFSNGDRRVHRFTCCHYYPNLLSLSLIQPGVSN